MGVDSLFLIVVFLLLVLVDFVLVIWFVYGYWEGILCLFDLWDWYGVKVMLYMIGEVVCWYFDLVCEIVLCGYEVVVYGLMWCV